LNLAISEINKKTDLNIALKSVEKADHSRVSTLIFAIKAQPVPKEEGRKIRAIIQHDRRGEIAG